MKIIGIDPGLNGGIVIFSEYGPRFHLMPVIEDEIDTVTLASIISDENDATAAYLEKGSARPGQGVVSMFKFGKVCGIIEGILAVNGIPIREVYPQTWMKSIHAQTGAPKMEPKARALYSFKRLFPKIDVRATDRCRKPHEGLVDAALIALYGYRLEKGI